MQNIGFAALDNTFDWALIKRAANVFAAPFISIIAYQKILHAEALFAAIDDRLLCDIGHHRLIR